MNTLKVTASAILVASFITTPILNASQSEDQIAIKLAEAMEKFYGKNVNDVNQYLRKEYGVKGPMKKEDSKLTYIVPVSDPLCGSINLETEGKQIIGLQTMTWKRGDENVFGRACDVAFSKK